jgi:hypothetical protein
LQAVREEALEERSGKERSGKDRSDCFIKVSKLITWFQFRITMNQNLRFNRGILLVKRLKSMLEASENQLCNPRKKSSFLSQLEEPWRTWQWSAWRRCRPSTTSSRIP